MEDGFNLDLDYDLYQGLDSRGCSGCLSEECDGTNCIADDFPERKGPIEPIEGDECSDNGSFDDEIPF